jgi:uncharacterized protein (DUF885 family)
MKSAALFLLPVCFFSAAPLRALPSSDKAIATQRVRVGQLPLAPPSPAAPVSAADRAAALATLFDEMWQDRLKHQPEFASSIGDLRYNDQLDDESAAAYNERLARRAEYLTRLAAIDTTGLPDQAQLSKMLMVEELVDEQAEAAFKPWEMPVDQFNGVQIGLPQLVSVLRFTTVKDYEDYAARLNQVPRVFSQVTDNMEAGIADKRVPPKYLLEKVLVQTNTLANAKAEDSPFARPLGKIPASISAEDQVRLRSLILDAIEKQVKPAYARFAKFLESTYIPAGRAEPGAWSLPNGDAYYAFRVKRSTTTDLTPDQIHQIGLDEVARDEAEMLAIAKKLGYPDVAALRAAVAADPKQHPTSREALLAVYRADLAQMKLKLPEYFGRLPKAPLEVEAVPDYLEKDQAPAYYNPGTADGSRPGRVFVNTYDFAHRSLANVESIAYHEGLPGHHLQNSIARELTGLPEFRKYLHYTAYGEGWGLYSERLGKDMGFYQDPYSDYGRLETDIFRAVRLVVDTGVHSKHWTRQQMVDYFHAHTGLDEATVQSETDRYVAWPAQALGYKMGQLKILELRAQAQKALGDGFDYRAFHDQVLDSGPLPLNVLSDRVAAWLQTQKAGK